MKGHTPITKIVVATLNMGKFRELEELLKDLPLELVPLAFYTTRPLIEEAGASYAENALNKARAVAAFLQEPALADDSGLEVDALGRRPGLFSSRYAGAKATDRENNMKLLRELEGVPWEERGATFKCALALAFPEGPELVVEGSCQGVIALAPLGEKGFGYDPLFVCHQGLTLAQLSDEMKNLISHRALSAAKLRQALPELFRGAGIPWPAGQ